MIRIQEEIEVWGTIVFVDATSTHLSEKSLHAAIVEVRAFTQHVDEVFSTYKPDSVVSKLRRGEVKIEDCSPEVIEVWNACANAQFLSDGAFDPWKVAGGFDPSGYVKGWAADICADMLVAAGAAHVQVNAAGDIALRGGYREGDVVKPWSIGVVNPENRLEVLQVFAITDGAIATSGTYERGAHINDPYTGMIAIGAESATVIGPDGGLTDALATALMVSGQDGAVWFSQPELADYSAWVINRNEKTSWALGPAITN